MIGAFILSIGQETEGQAIASVAKQVDFLEVIKNVSPVNKAINIVSPSHDGAWPGGNAVAGVAQTTTPVTTHRIPIKKPRAAKILIKTAKTSPTLPIRSAIFSLSQAIARSPATIRTAGAN